MSTGLPMSGVPALSAARVRACCHPAGIVARIAPLLAAGKVMRLPSSATATRLPWTMSAPLADRATHPGVPDA